MAAEGCQCNENGVVTIKEPKCICANCEMYKRKYSAAEHTNSNKSVLIDMLQQELKKKENIYKEMIDEYEKLRFKHCSVVQELEDLKEVYRRVKDENSRLLKAKEISKRHQKELISTLKEELDEWKKQFNELQHRIQPTNDLNHRIGRIEKLLQNQGITMIELVKKFLEEIRNMNLNSNNAPKYSMGTITNDYGDPNSRMKELEDDNENLNILVKKLTQENKDIKNRLNEKKQKLSDCICVLEKNENNIKNLSQDVENIIEDKSNVSKENLKLRAQIEYLEDKLDEKIDEIKHLNESPRNRPGCSGSQTTEDSANLKKQLDTMNQNYRLLNDTIRVLTGENKSNLQVIEDLTNKINELNQEKQDAEKAWEGKYNRLKMDFKNMLKKKRRKAVDAKLRENVQYSCDECENISPRDSSPYSARSPFRKISIPTTFSNASPEIGLQTYLQSPPQTASRFSPSVTTSSRKTRQREMTFVEPRIIPSTPVLDEVSICDRMCSTRRGVSAFDKNLLHAGYGSVGHLDTEAGSTKSVGDTPRRREKTKDESTPKKALEASGKTSERKESDSKKRVSVEEPEGQKSPHVGGECKAQCAQTPDFPTRQRDVMRYRRTRSCGHSPDGIDDINSDNSFEQMKRYLNQQAVILPERRLMKKPLKELTSFTSERFEDSGSFDRSSEREDGMFYVSCPIRSCRTYVSSHDIQVDNNTDVYNGMKVHLEPRETHFESVSPDFSNDYPDADDAEDCLQRKSELFLNVSNNGRISTEKPRSVVLKTSNGVSENLTTKKGSPAELPNQASDYDGLSVLDKNKSTFSNIKLQNVRDSVEHLHERLDDKNKDSPPPSKHRKSVSCRETVSYIDVDYNRTNAQENEVGQKLEGDSDFRRKLINVSPSSSEHEIDNINKHQFNSFKISPRSSRARSTGVDESIQVNVEPQHWQDSVTDKRSTQDQTWSRFSPMTSRARATGIDEAVQVYSLAEPLQDEMKDKGLESFDNGVQTDLVTDRRSTPRRSRARSEGIDESTQVGFPAQLLEDNRKTRRRSTSELPQLESKTDEHFQNLFDDIFPDDYIARSNERDEDDYHTFSKDSNLMYPKRSRKSSVSWPDNEEKHFFEKGVGSPSEKMVQNYDNKFDSHVDPKKPRGSPSSSGVPCAEYRSQTEPTLRIESWARIEYQTDHQLLEIEDITLPSLTTEEDFFGESSEASRMSSRSSETPYLGGSSQSSGHGTSQIKVQDSPYADPESSKAIPEKFPNRTDDRLCAANTQVKSFSRAAQTETMKGDKAVGISVENSNIHVQTINQFGSPTKPSVKDNSCQTEVSVVEKKVGGSVEVITKNRSLLTDRFNTSHNAAQTHYPSTRSKSIGVSPITAENCIQTDRLLKCMETPRLRKLSEQVCPMTGENCVQTERVLRCMETLRLRRLSEQPSNTTKDKCCCKDDKLACQLHVHCSEICQQPPTAKPLSQEKSVGTDGVPVADEDVQTDDGWLEVKKSNSPRKSKIPTSLLNRLKHKCKTKPDSEPNRENIEEVTKEKDRIISDLRAETSVLRELEIDYERLLKDNKRLEDELMKVEDKLKQLALERNELFTENETLRESCSAIGKNKDIVKKQIEAKQGLEKFENMDYDPSGLNLIVSTLNEKLQELEGENCKKSLIILSLEACVDRSNDILGDCENEIRAMLQQNEALKEKNEQLAKTLQFSSGNQNTPEIQEKVSYLMKEYQNLLREATEKDKELEQIKRKYDILCNSSRSVGNAGISPRVTLPKTAPSPGQSTDRNQDNNKKKFYSKKSNTSDLRQNKTKKSEFTNRTKCGCDCAKESPTDSPRSSGKGGSMKKSFRKTKSTPTESPRSSQNEGSPEKPTRTNKPSSCGSSCPCDCWKHARSRLRDLHLGKGRKQSESFVEQMRRCSSKPDSLNLTPDTVKSDYAQLRKKEETIKRLYNEKVNLQLKLNSLRFNMTNITKEHSDLKTGITCLLNEIIKKLQIITNTKGRGSLVMSISPGTVANEVLDSLTQLEQSLSAKKSCNCMSVIKSKYLLDQQVIARQMYMPLFNKFFCDYSSESKSNNSSVEVFDITELEVEKDNADTCCKC